MEVISNMVAMRNQWFGHEELKYIEKKRNSRTESCASLESGAMVTRSASANAVVVGNLAKKRRLLGRL